MQISLHVPAAHPPALYAQLLPEHPVAAVNAGPKCNESALSTSSWKLASYFCHPLGRWHMRTIFMRTTLLLCCVSADARLRLAMLAPCSLALAAAAAVRFSLFRNHQQHTSSSHPSRPQHSCTQLQQLKRYCCALPVQSCCHASKLSPNSLYDCLACSAHSILLQLQCG